MEEIDKNKALKEVEGIEGSDQIKLGFIKSQLDQTSADAELRAIEKAELIAMRGKWSMSVLVILAFIVITDTFFIYAVGLGWLNFSNNYVIPAFIGEGLIKTIGLAYIIVNFLFNKDSFNIK